MLMYNTIQHVGGIVMIVILHNRFISGANTLYMCVFAGNLGMLCLHGDLAG